MAIQGQIKTLLHDMTIRESDVADVETLNLVRDIWSVWNSLHQGMPVIGQWLEQRIRWLIRSWLPEWQVSQGQVFDPERPELRSRSWDVIIHRPAGSSAGLPPEAAPGLGPPLVPRGLCCAVVDTKNNFSDVGRYASAKAFNLMNDCELPQLDLLESRISKNVFAASSYGRPDTLHAKGMAVGLNFYVLGRYVAEPVKHDRKTWWELWQSKDGITPLQAFRGELLRAAGNWEPPAAC
jgi:hypothetical protein